MWFASRSNAFATHMLECICARVTFTELQVTDAQKAEASQLVIEHGIEAIFYTLSVFVFRNVMFVDLSELRFRVGETLQHCADFCKVIVVDKVEGDVVCIKR